MGLHLHLQTVNGEKHPDWDWIRHSGDEDFVRLKERLPYEHMLIGTHPDQEPVWRPTRLEAWRSELERMDFPNRHRFEHLFGLIEANPDHWLYESW